jgi:hypothetical protein
MITPGGSHVDTEIPERVARMRTRRPAHAIDYAWPIDLEDVAAFLSSSHVSGHLRRRD